MPTKKPTARTTSGSRKPTQSSGKSVTQKARSAAGSVSRSAKNAASTVKGAAGSVSRSAKDAASTVKSAAGSFGDKVARGAKSVKEGTGMSTGQLLAGAAGLAAAATAGAVLYKTKGGSGHRTVYHVKPNGDGWAVKGAGAKRAASTHSTKKEALEAARELAHGKVPSQLVVHRADGSVQEKLSYDPE
jgi:hypothetical protein